MEAVVEDLSGPPERAIHCASDANRETLHPARERELGVGLHDHVEVVPLHRKLDDAETRPLVPGADRVLDGEIEPALAEVRDVVAEPQGDVCRTRPRMPRTAAVRDATLPLTLPAGTLSLPAPGAEHEGTLSWQRMLKLRVIAALAGWGGFMMLASESATAEAIALVLPMAGFVAAVLPLRIWMTVLLPAQALLLAGTLYLLPEARAMTAWLFWLFLGLQLLLNTLLAIQRRGT